MDDIEKAIIFMVVGLWLMGLPIFAGYLAGFYGVFMFCAITFFAIVG